MTKTHPEFKKSYIFLIFILGNVSSIRNPDIRIPTEIKDTSSDQVRTQHPHNSRISC